MKSLKLVLFFSSFIAASYTFAFESSLKGEVPLTHANWTGLYGGFNIGGVNHTMNITDLNATSFLSTIEQVSGPEWSGGLQLGYRYQLDLNPITSVYGLEASANFSDATFNETYGSPFALYQLDSQNTLKTVCLLELIAGIAANKTLLFLAAGASWVNLAGTTTNVDSIAFFNSFKVDKKVWGTALGAGIEYIFWDKLSARIKVDVITPSVYNTSDNVNDPFQISNQIVQGTLGIQYKFF